MNDGLRWDVDRPDLSWTIDLMHNPKPYPPLMHDFRRFIAEGTTRAFVQLGIPTRVHYQPVHGYTYGAHERLESVPAPQRTMAERSASLWQDWQNTYLPEIRQIYARWDAAESAAAEDATLRDHLEWVLDRSVRMWEIHFLVVEPAFDALNAFFDFSHRAVAGTGDLDAAILLQGYPNVLADVEDALWNRARRGPDDAEGIAAFLRTFGSLGDEQGEFFSSSWADAPARLIREIARHADAPDPRIRRAELAEAREAALTAVRSTLAADGRAQFDALHERARVGGVLSEDHHFYIDRQWLWRIKRLCARYGTWLHTHGRLADPGDVHFVTLDELRAGISGSIIPAALPAERRVVFEQQRHLSPPLALGRPEPVQEADRFWGPPAPQSHADRVQGLPASPGVAQGRAVVLMSLDDLDRLARGDVLVCGTTNASLVSVFDVIGALVTDTGGVLSHAAVVAREFGLPAVVGTKVATQRIRTGQRVEVNGTSGEVRLL